MKDELSKPIGKIKEKNSYKKTEEQTDQSVTKEFEHSFNIVYLRCDVIDKGEMLKICLNAILNIWMDLAEYALTIFVDFN